MTTAMTAAATRPEQTFCLHGLRVDLPAHRVCRGRQEITLTPQEYALLEALVVNHDLAMTRVGVRLRGRDPHRGRPHQPAAAQAGPVPGDPDRVQGGLPAGHP